ncbi:hypothetical protein HKX48_002572 [Thoreauomyces humboldtii]|nr:hypothetical protein HKX48_002572 [Thoreauomyces humboldtii]
MDKGTAAHIAAAALSGVSLDAGRRSATPEALAILVREDPSLFLEKWGSRLSSMDLALFDSLADTAQPGDYEVAAWLKRLRHSDGPTPAQLRNRRLAYMTTVAGAEHFTISALQARAPSYLRPRTDSHHPPAPTPFPLGPLVDRVYAIHDRAEAEERAREAEEEVETDSEDEEGDDESRSQEPVTNDELRERMIRRWLAGEDDPALYGDVDDDSELDATEAAARDMDDAYFEDDDDDDEGANSAFVDPDAADPVQDF